MKLKKGDQIIVTIGKDKGKKGNVERVFPKTQSVLVPGINVFKKHKKKRDEKNPGGIVEIVKPLNVAKVALVCPKCGKQTRVGYQIVKSLPAGRQGVKERICKKCEQTI
ncbi:MAG: 50S ribosomal protein L24 [Candidatus Gottesmanbacteria bacterium GW2011_GWB1_49_7]|uniref:Large ribosomal subunit protein uL24 n=1 Tax=Candidatus Gottesmanbacteria bacterium GW2011_GWB1_49_7 TaxID=1618448 RepID=A0A0G1VYK5_9BACT|nr:MAG: 50S ribosomal protein L24 [Microgenomates group bacterium GW2011_GWC1_49_7]KKW11425.1 MAG: 50S ribosomal protein L24 [Candidatus Gottesmanbacteria bacterium GW2011_GWB1_49_7]